MKKTLILFLAAALFAASACTPAPTAPQAEAPAMDEPTPVIVQPAEEAAPVDGALVALLQTIATDYQPGTAGCSLTAARLAGELLDWNAANAPSTDAVAAAAKAAYDALSPEMAAEYAALVGDIYDTAKLLTKDDALDLLESAGYTPTALPYAEADVDALFMSLLSVLPAGVPAGTEATPFLHEVPAAQTISLDMDGDGMPEQATVVVNEDAYTTDVTVTGAAGTLTSHLEVALDFLSAYVASGVQDNPGEWLFLSGNEGSDDYETFVFRMQNGALERAEVFGRLLDANRDGVVTLETPIDVFGTYGGTCQYRLQSDFTFAHCSPYTVVPYDGGNDRTLTVIAESLPVTAADGTKTTLPKGTKLLLTETDQKSYALVADEAGVSYRVAIERKPDEWQWYIDNVPESDYLDPLLYAG